MAATFEDVIAVLKENNANDTIRSEELKNQIIASAKTTNRSFGMSLAKQFGKQIGLQEDALQAQAAMIAEQERLALLQNEDNKTTAVEGKDLGGGVFKKSLSGLKALIGSVGIFFLGILGVVKGLQNPDFKNAVKDLFTAMRDVFVFIKDEVFKPLGPILLEILKFTVVGLTKGFELVLETFKLIKDFGVNGPKPEEYKGLPAAGLGLTALFNSLLDPKTGIIGRFVRRVKISLELATRNLTRFFTGGKGVGLFGKEGLVTKIKGIFKPVTDLGKTVAKLPVISSFTTFFSKTGGFLKLLGKLFLPFTIIIAAFDTIKGIIDGVTGAEGEATSGPAGMVVKEPPSKMKKLLAGIEGGLKGLVNSLVGMPLNFLKSAVGFVLGKFGFTGAEQALKEFSFTELFDSIIGAIFSPIETIKNLATSLKEKLNLPSMQEIFDTVDGFRKKIFSKPSESESGKAEIFGFELPELPSISGMFDSLKNLAKKIYDPETGEIFGFKLPSFPSLNLPNIGDMMMNVVGGMLPDPNGMLGFIYKFLPDELKMAAEAFSSGATFSGGSIVMPGSVPVVSNENVTEMTPDDLLQIIEALESAADTADIANDIQEESRLLNRIEELEALYDDAIRNDRQTVTVVNTDNKQIQTNNTGNTVSVGKDTTPNDPTTQLLLQGAGSPMG